MCVLAYPQAALFTPRKFAMNQFLTTVSSSSQKLCHAMFVKIDFLASAGKLIRQDKQSKKQENHQTKTYSQ